MNIELNVIEFKQNDTVGYLTSVKYSQIKDSWKVDTWNPKNPLGYQRPHKEAKSKKFASFLAGESAICPVPVIANIRREDLDPAEDNKLSFNNKTNTISFDSKQTIWIAEGQHRMYGYQVLFRDSGIDCDIPVVLMNVPQYLEIWQFITINQEQTKVQRDRAEEAIITFKDKLPDGSKMTLGNLKKDKEIAIHISNNLNSQAGSPFQGRIDKTGNEVTSVVKATSFNVAIENVVKQIKTKPRFAKGNITLIKEASTWLSAYWRAVNAKMPDAFQNEKEYLVLKTAGIFTLNRLAAKTVGEMGGLKGKCKYDSLSEQTYLEIFRSPEMSPFMDAEFWSVDNDIDGAKSYGSSQQSYARILEVMETKMLTAIEKYKTF